MGNRREFLLTAAAAALASTTGASRALGAEVESGAGKADAAPSHAADDATAPDTLDLAEHGRLGLNGVLGSLNPACDFECTFLNILDTKPAYMLHWSSMLSGVWVKYLESLPMLRVMSGSRELEDLEVGFLDAIQRNMAEDGLVYDTAIPSRPWNVGVHYGIKDWNEDYACMAGNGRALQGMLFMQQWTGDAAWGKRARRTAERMLELAISEGDRAWYPNPGLGNDFSYPRHSGWTKRDAPQSPNEGFEGGAMFYHLQPLRGFVRYYQESGDERFIELSRKFINLGLDDKFWSDSPWLGKSGATRGHFAIHFHASMAAVRAVLDYGLVTGDARTQQFAHDSYNYARQTGISHLGLFPTRSQGTEGCSIADMIGMAVALSDGGLGDYWDDVELYARNGLVSAQATDLEELKRVSSEGKERPAGAEWGGEFDSRFRGGNKGVLPGQEIHDRVLERSIGAFGHVVGARYQTPMMMHCCTANCTQALYYAWEGIVRREGDGVAVNMWLNRRSPWADVWCDMPHEGRLVVRNKGMRRISIRKPSWIARRELRCRIDGGDVSPRWQSGRMVFDGLKGNELLTIEAPLREEAMQAIMVNIGEPKPSTERYEMAFRGHTAVAVKCIELAPDSKERNWYRIFQREAMRVNRTPRKPMPGYVHGERLIHWEVV